MMTIVKLRMSVTDPSGKVRWDIVLNDLAYMRPLMTVLILDGALTFLL